MCVREGKGDSTGSKIHLFKFKYCSRKLCVNKPKGCVGYDNMFNG